MSDIVRLGGSRLQGPMGSLTRHVCPECGKAFECGAEWSYMRRTGDGNRAYYCSYSCYRVEGRRDEERERERIARENERLDTASEYQRQWRERQKQRKAREDAQARAEQCRERIAHFAALADLCPKGSRERKNARKSTADWRRKLALCQKKGAEDHANHDG